MKLLLLLMLFATQASAQSLTSLVTELASTIDTNSKVAVLEFSYMDNKASDGPYVIQERIATILTRKHMGTVVERRLLDRVLGELRFQASGAVDASAAKRVGRVLGADYVITGTLNDITDKKVEVYVRLIDVETSKVLGADSVKITKTWTDDSDTVVQEPPSHRRTTRPKATKRYMDDHLTKMEHSLLGMVKEDAWVTITNPNTGARVMNNGKVSVTLKSLKEIEEEDKMYGEVVK